MIKVKKIIFLVTKSVFTIIILLTLVLFFYAAFFYEPSHVEIETTENQITENEKPSDINEEKEQRLTESQIREKISEPEVEKTKDSTQGKVKISDALFMTVGNKATTKSDIVHEIKIILILNNQSYSAEKRDQLQELAVKSIIKRNVKQIALENHNFFQFNQQDLESELMKLATNIDVDIETLKNIFASNDIDFSIIEDQIKVQLFWNSLIFQIYKNRITIDPDDINEKLKLIQNNKKTKEYLISEILMNVTQKDKLEEEIDQLKNKIKIEGFENVAKSLSISESAVRGGDLGWLNENIISEKIKSNIINTPVGQLSEPITLREGVLIFKIRDKRNIKNNKSLEEIKNELVNDEKTKMLQMYSLSHYDKLRRTINIKFNNE